MNILFITTEWATDERPYDAPFIWEYVRALQEAGIHVDVFHFKGQGNPLNYLRAWITIRKSDLWQKADILHAHWGQSAILGLFSRKPMVVTFHGSDLHGIVNQNGKYSIKGKLLVAVSKWLSKKADQVVVVSERMKKLIPEDVQSIEVIPMGIDTAIFRPLDQAECRYRLGLDPDTRYILFASDPKRREKRYQLALEATNFLNAEQTAQKVELLVVNNQPHYKMPEYLNACDVLLLTSSHEGSPVIIKEALACNLPVVSVDVGDVSERISGIKGCYLCPDDEVETIVKFLKKAIAKNSRVNGLSSVQSYAWEIVSQQTITIYQKCLE